MIVITGIGVLTPVATGVTQFTTALQKGGTNYSVLELDHAGKEFRFPVAQTDNFDFQGSVAEIDLDTAIINKATRLRNISSSHAYGVYCALEAWADAGLNQADINPERVAIVSAGTNVQQASLGAVQEKYKGKLQFFNPHYGLNFFDSDLVGVLSELLAIRGEGCVIGAASASGNAAIIQGHRLINSNEYDVVLVVAPLMDLSIFEYQGLTAIGAMAEIQTGVIPSEICRPFDLGHRGFVYGQSAGAVIIESAIHAAKRGKSPYGSIAGYGTSLDGNRNPNPSAEGELKAMKLALQQAGVPPGGIDYVNTHGTASSIGDETEVSALLALGLEGVKANSTKSLIGHGLSAAGVVECIASLIQMKEGFLHPCHNLINPITDRIDWVKDESRPAAVRYAISNSFGFGGINTSIIIKNNQN